MDKELALILSEILIKQDENTDHIKETNAQLRETNTILKDFMEVSVKQWQQQHVFNELIAKELRGITGTITTAIQLEARLKAVEERENNFELRLANVEKLLKAS